MSAPPDDGYDAMGREELLVRVRDWRQVANDRSTEIGRLQHQRSIVDVALRDAVAAREHLQNVIRGTLLAIESILTDDHQDLGVSASTILGRVSGALRAEIAPPVHEGVRDEGVLDG